MSPRRKEPVDDSGGEGGIARPDAAADSVVSATEPEGAETAAMPAEPGRGTKSTDAGEGGVEVPTVDRRVRRGRDTAARSRFDLETRPRASAALRYGTLALLLSAPTLVGGTHFATGVGLGAAALILGAIALLGQDPQRARFGVVGAALVIWLVVTAVQAVPLPIGLVEALNPAVAAHYRDAYAAVGETARWVPLSLSPDRTAMSLWHLLGFVGLFAVGFNYFASHKWFEWLLPRVVAVGLVFAVLSIVQTGFFDASVLGLYQQQSAPQAGLRLLTPLVNPNHAAAYFGAMAALALGVGLGQKGASQHYTFLAFYLLLTVAMFVNLSRGAILAWAASHIVLVYLLNGYRLRNKVLAVVVAGAMLGAVAAAVYLANKELGDTFDSMVSGANELVQDLGNRDGEPEEVGNSDPQTAPPAPREKVAIYRDLTPIVADYAPIGIGRDAFAEVYPRYATHSLPMTHLHVENEYLEFVVEYGLTFALLFFGLVGFGMVRVLGRNDWRSAERPLLGGVAASVLFIALQNALDFNMRFPGVGFLLALLLGCLVGRGARYARARARGSEDANGEPSTPAPLWRTQAGFLARAGRGAAMVAILAALTIALATTPAARTGASDSDVEALRQFVESIEAAPTSADADGLRSDLMAAARAALTSRPAAGYLRFLVAVGMLRTGPGGLEAATPWLEQAQTLSPSDFRIHLLLGRSHAARGAFGAAAAELSEAATLQAGPSREVARTAAEWLPDVDALVQSLSRDPADWIAVGEALVQRRRFAEAIELAERIRAQWPQQPQGLEMGIAAELALGIPEAAESGARQLVEAFPQYPQSFATAARVATSVHDTKAADALLSRGSELHPRDLKLLLYRLDLLLGPGRDLFEKQADWSIAIDELLERARPLALVSPGGRFRYHTIRGRYLQTKGELRPALRAFEDALKAYPNAAPALRQAALVSIELGDIARAERYVEQLAKRAEKAEIDSLRKRIESRREDRTKHGLPIGPEKP